MRFERWQLPQEVKKIVYKYWWNFRYFFDNIDESGNALDIGGSDIDNNSSDSEFEYEYEPLHQRKPEQAEIQHLESTPQYVKSPLRNTPNGSVIDTENNYDEAGNSNSTVKATNSGRHFLMVIVPLVVMSTHRIIKELNMNLKPNTNPQITMTVTLLMLQ